MTRYPLVFKNARVITCDADHRVLDVDVGAAGDSIVALQAGLSGEEEVDLSGKWLFPGFVQTHVHLVQTLFRDLADDLQLMDWLRQRIWPLERAHDVDSTYASARLGISELLCSGTTAILDMASVGHTDAIFQAATESGIRLWCGKAQMDRPNEAGLSESLDMSMRSACDLADRWHKKGRLHYAFAPRFVPSCTDDLLRAAATEARRRGCLIHTHASENLGEVELVRELTGADNIVHLARLGLVGPDVALAHCIHLTAEEEGILADTGTRLLHCPSSNLKLASGVARIPELLDRGIHVSVGADGAPCNNRLDAFAELRLAALLPKPRLGAEALPAPVVLKLGTVRGAEALGFPGGEIAVGKLADLVVLNPGRLWTGGDPRSALVYTMDARCVEQTWIGGQKVAENGHVLGWDSRETVGFCQSGLQRVRQRAGC